MLPLTAYLYRPCPTKVARPSVPPEEPTVTLWKAPAPERTGVVEEIQTGFSPERYPGYGLFVAQSRQIAIDAQRSYGNGVQEIRLPTAIFERLVRLGVLQKDPYRYGRHADGGPGSGARQRPWRGHP